MSSFVFINFAPRIITIFLHFFLLGVMAVSGYADKVEDQIVRNLLWDVIDQINPGDKKEKFDIEFTKNLVLSDKEIYRIKKPDIPNIHLVAYCLLIDFENKKMLLGHHKDSNLWLPPGGHCDQGELPIDTAKRELQEEIGIAAPLFLEAPIFLALTKTKGLKDNGHIDVGFWYISIGDSSQSHSFDQSEFKDVKWFLFDEIPECTDPHMKRFLKKIRQQCKVNF
jgi:8-oxo-dGTP diphosphatase